MGLRPTIERLRRAFGGALWRPVEGTSPAAVTGSSSEVALRKASASLRVAHERLELAADSGGLGLWDLDLATGVAWRTLQHDRLFGYDELQPTWGREVALQHVVPEDRAAFQGAFDEAFATGRFHYLLRVQPQGQPLRWLEADGQVRRDEAGRPVRMAGTVRDVTARRMAEAVAAARLRLREQAPGCTVQQFLTAVLDEAEVLTGSTIGFLHFVGEDQTTLLLQAWSSHTTARMCTAEGAGAHYPVAQAGVWADAVRERRAVVHNDYAALPNRRGMPAGHSVVVREAVVPVIRDGRVCALIGVGNKATDYLDGDVELLTSLADQAWDLAARIRAEAAQRASAAYARTLLEASLDPLVTISPAGLITDVNRAAEAATGLARAQLVGTDFARHFTEPERAQAGWQAVLATGQVRDYPLTLRHVSGATTEVLFNATVYRGPDGAVLGVFAAARDLTEMRALQARLATATRLASLGTLVAGAAHEINNPLAADLSNQEVAIALAARAQALVGGDGPCDRSEVAGLLEEVGQVLGDARDAAERIAQIVRDMTLLSRPETGRSRRRVADLVAEALRQLPAYVDELAEVRVRDEGAPDVLVAAGRIEQVLVNLIGNAAKASFPGRRNEILVRLGAGGPGMACLEISDQGEGIEPANLGRIFDPFFTTRPTGARRGTGLGLTICHAIVTAHGGTIGVASELGKGATFRVELPAAAGG